MPDRAEKGLTRRRFLERAGQGLAVASAFGTMARRAFAQQVPEPPGRKLGWAIVGLGNLAINQILPAFAKAEKSKVVALVSGHPDKAKKDAAAARVDERLRAAFHYLSEFVTVLNEATPVSEGSQAVMFFGERTGMSISAIEAPLREAEAKGLIYRDHKLIRPTELGQRFLNDLQEMFLAD